MAGSRFAGGSQHMGAHIAIKTTRGVKYLSVVDITKDSSGRQRQKVLESLGRLDAALNEDPGVLARLRAKYKITSKAEQALEAVRAVRKAADAAPAVPGAKAGRFNAQLNYGYLALRRIWNEDLKLDYRLGYLQETKSRSAGDLPAAAFYLAAVKLAGPRSNYSSYASRATFLNDPLEGVSLDDVYNTLDFMDEMKDGIMSFVNRRMVERFGRDASMVFYDCTNAYFEAPYDDKQKLFREILAGIRAQEGGCGADLQKLESLADDPEMIDKAIRQLKALATDETCFRMRGLSKEHRFDLPLVSIALVIDNRGIPIDFSIFPGNTSEFKTMPKVIKEMVAKYGVKNAIVVADRGLNSAANLSMLAESGLGFIVAQKVSNLKAGKEAEMLDLEHGYKPWPQAAREDLLANADLLGQAGLEGDMVFKRSSFTKSAFVQCGDSGRRKVEVECGIMFTFSKKRRRRDLAQLDSDVAMASQAAEERRDMTPSMGAGWRSLLNTVKEGDQGERNGGAPGGKGKKRIIYRADSIKEDVIKERRRRAGFSAVVFKEAKGMERITDAELMGSYHQLVRIEECFRIMKSNFSVRPVYVRSRSRIRGHICLCVLALIIERILELRLAESGCKLSIAQIQEGLGSTITAVSADGCNGVFIKNGLASGVYTKENMKARTAGEKEMDRVELAVEHYIADGKPDNQPADQILKAVGLTPLPPVADAGTVSSCLKIRGDYRRLVGPAISRIQGGLAAVSQ